MQRKLGNWIVLTPNYRPTSKEKVGDFLGIIMDVILLDASNMTYQKSEALVRNSSIQRESPLLLILRRRA